VVRLRALRHLKPAWVSSHACPQLGVCALDDKKGTSITCGVAIVESFLQVHSTVLLNRFWIVGSSPIDVR
jgi:hypothetical protein